MSSIEHEVKPKVARTVIVVAATAAALGIIYGYDNGVVGGALLFFDADLNITSDFEQGLVVAIIVAGEIIGAILASWLVNKIGRKKSMLVVALGYAVFGIASALAFDFWSLAIARFLLGIAIGISLVAVPVFIAESVPARIRGSILVLYQVMGVCGIILGLLLSFLLADSTFSGNWRIMLGAASIPAIILLPVILRLPETARWYVMKGRHEDAKVSLALTDPEVNLDAELADMERAQAENGDGSVIQSLKEMVKKPYLRATTFVIVLGAFIQLTGINATVTYGPKIFEAMGIVSNAEKIGMSLLVQFFALASVLVAMRYVDRWGRRPILLTGIGIMVFAQLVMVATFASYDGVAFQTWEIVLGFSGLALINVGFVFGFGALVWVYSSEAFPAHLRTYGSSAMLTSDLIANFIVVYGFIIVMNAIGGAGSFLIFAILAAIAWLFVLKFAPETKGRELEEIRHYWEAGGKWPDRDASGEVPPQPADGHRRNN